MVVVDRQDGLKFIVQAYRETLVRQSRRLLVQDIRLLAKQHGPYASLYAHDKDIETAFAAESGYLLGECVWDYFGRPDDLIYCEALGQRSDCLLVVIRDGRVYLDMKLLSSQIQDELQPILADKQPYVVYTYGDVPLRDTETFGGATFTLPKEMCGQFNQLREPLFNSLIPASKFALKPADKLSFSSLSRHQNKWIGLGLIVVLLAVGGWRYHSSSQISLVPTHAVLQSSFQREWQTTFHQPSPVTIMRAVVDHLDAMYLIPGWQASAIHYASHQFQAHLKATDGGNLWSLTDWAKQHYYTMHRDSNDAVLEADPQLPVRESVPDVITMPEAVSAVTRRLSQLLTADAIHIGTASRHGHLQTVPVELTIHSLSPDLLSLVGEEFNHLPVTLSTADLTIDDGLINGTLHLSLWGR